MTTETQPTVADKWSAEYQQYIENPPQPGSVLSAFGDDDARLDIELHEGKPPFIYGRAFVPCVVGQPLGWYLQAFDTENAYGWKCILLPRAREELLRRRGLTDRKVSVKALRVIRKSNTGNSLLCEVEAY